eukprot:RCo035041
MASSDVASLEGLFSLTYVSKWAKGLSSADLSAHISRWEAKNGQTRLTSCLVTMEEVVVQTLEGPRAVVEATFERIRSSPLHQDHTVLSQRSIEDRGFPGCSLQWLPIETTDYTYPLVQVFSAMGVQLAKLVQFCPPGVRAMVVRGVDPLRAPPAAAAGRFLVAFRLMEWNTVMAKMASLGQVTQGRELTRLLNLFTAL